MRFLVRGRRRVVVAIGAGVAVVAAGAAVSQAGGPHGFRVVSDSFSGHSKVSEDVLRNDSGATAVVRHSSPAGGTVTVGADGAFVYTPKAGFKGTDSFTYTATDAVQVFKNSMDGGGALAPLAKVAGPGGSTTEISGEGFGSALAAAPGYFYGLTDRGPNADTPDPGPLQQNLRDRRRERDECQ